MVLLHHEIEIEFPESKCIENHTATLLEFGRTKNGKMISAMALTVGVPVAIGALVLAVHFCSYLPFSVKSLILIL